MAEKKQTIMAEEIKNLKALSISSQPINPNQIKEIVVRLEQGLKEQLETVRLANVCLVYRGLDDDRFNYFKSLFLRQCKKIYI